ncbi:hypothetical protein MMC17_008976 [Xylographa soralifera]|nr:hypothetical protein [Xylographa soralifera]
MKPQDQRALEPDTRAELLESSVLRKGWAASKDVATEQEINEENDELIPSVCTGVKSLRRLRNVRFCNEWHMESKAFHESEIPGKGPFCRVGSLMARGWNPPYLKPNPEGYSYNMHETFHALVSALAWMRTPIKSFVSSNLGQEAFDLTMMTRVRLQYTVAALARLEIFVLNTPAAHIGGHWTHDVRGVPLVLRSMPRLKTLSIDMDEHRELETPTLYLPKILGAPAPNFPSLTNLSLSSMRCFSSDLIGYVSHLPALRSLYLRHIELEDWPEVGSWAQTFDMFRQCLRLSSFATGWPLTDTNSSHLFEDFTQEGKLLQSQLVVFILHGGQNPLRPDYDPEVFERFKSSIPDSRNDEVRTVVVLRKHISEVTCKKTPLISFPVEILLMILGTLEKKERKAIRLVSRTWSVAMTAKPSEMVPFALRDRTRHIAKITEHPIGSSSISLLDYDRSRFVPDISKKAYLELPSEQVDIFSWQIARNAPLESQADKTKEFMEIALRESEDRRWNQRLWDSPMLTAGFEEYTMVLLGKER